jgi:DNA-binding cell septation regulator SpoVG
MKGIMVELRTVENMGKLKAFADVIVTTELGDIVIKSFRVVQDEGKEPWVGFPQIPIQKNGKIVYLPLLEISRGLKHSLQEMILEEYKKNKK